MEIIIEINNLRMLVFEDGKLLINMVRGGMTTKRLDAIVGHFGL
jgi:hypothetical protein